MSELDEIETLLKKREKEKAFELVKDKDTNSLAERLIERGSSLIENEEYDFAITYLKFSDKIAIDKDIKETAREHLRYAYGNRGNAYRDLKRYEEAIADYNKAVELEQNFDIAHANLGDLLFMIEDYDNAEKGYREALRINEDIDYAHNCLGLVLSKRKACKDAIAEFKNALELNTDADFYNSLGCAYAAYGKGSAIAPFRIFKARKKLGKATKQNKKIKDVYCYEYEDRCDCDTG